MADRIQDSPIIPPAAIPTPFVGCDEERLKKECAKLTPPNAKLRELAKKNAPPPEYFEGDVEIPFDPIEE